jgi:hypothetical protein
LRTPGLVDSKNFIYPRVVMMYKTKNFMPITIDD